MGYHIHANGYVIFDKENESRIVEALKRLNHLHYLKTGERYPKTGNVWEDSWFAWMPNDYHLDDSIKTVSAILQMLDYNVFFESRNENGIVRLELGKDGKLGDEEYFFAVLAQEGCDVEMHVTGDDDNWYWCVGSEPLTNGDEEQFLEIHSRPQAYEFQDSVVINWDKVEA